MSWAAVRGVAGDAARRRAGTSAAMWAVARSAQPPALIVGGRTPAVSLTSPSRPTAARGSASTAAPESNAVVLSKRLPKDFVETTLLPHLESQLLENIHAYTPAELCKISKAYCKQDVRQYALCKKLGEQVVDRLTGFEAVDLIDILGPAWVMLPGDDDLFSALEGRIIEKLDDFTGLNLIGIIRIFNKRSTKHQELLSNVLPRLKELLNEYEAVELAEMLMSIAQASEATQDMDILMILVPEIERRYGEVSLVHAINNVWALAQLKVCHEGLLGRVAQDLQSETRTKDLTPAFMARIVWVYRRCGAWAKISESLLPLIRASVANFKCGDFARLAQSLPEEGELLRQIAGHLSGGITEMGRKDMLLFFLGCAHGELFETEREAPDDPTTMIGQCFVYLREEQDNFKRDEVQKIVYLLWYAPKYHHVLDCLPASWNGSKEETVDYIRAKS